ncbi:MAG: PSD1 and planctomycete cytochrome C domain-containing protein [Planctomycetota bacterium]
MNRSLIILGLLIGFASQSYSQEITDAQSQFFESKIRPVLVSSCYECHSKKTGKNEGGITLDTKVGLRQGGNSGPGVTPHDLDESWVWRFMTHRDKNARMPPESTLSNQVLADFKKWIEMGAPDPREDGLPATVISSIDVQKGREFWSFQKPRKSVVPEVEDEEWSKTEVDRFVRSRLDAAGMTPTPAADSTTLLRRLNFDLIGLPPSPDDIARFQKAWTNDSQSAIQSEVDRLLQSRHFGERWGRHWLDVARYAESNGKQSNQSYPQAWKYRDYVIESINNDKPFNRFVQEQIAGDLLPARTDAAWREGIIATGFLAIGSKPLREESSRQFTMDMVDEQIDATTQAILGLTVACARCHDHKSDPIPTADYYALAGIFLSSKTLYGTFGGGQSKNRSDLIILPASRAKERLTASEIVQTKQELADVERQLREFANAKRARMQAQKEAPNENMSNGRTSARRIRERQNQLVAKLGSVDSQGLIKEFGMGMQDYDQPINANLLVRGEIDQPAQLIPRGFLQVLNHAPQRVTSNGSGRRELAQWLTSENNPLTARVFVNRVWDKLFGRGIVSSTNSFGVTGMAPTHPELLDHLSVDFMKEGWSIKSLVQKLVMTRTYQASGQFHQANYDRDPENNLLWRAAPRRLDAEAIRDSMLAVTGELNLVAPAGSRVHEIGNEELGRRGSPDLMLNLPPVRSVYLPAVRDHMPELIKLFDGADPNVVTGHRDVSNVAGQALYLMNNEFVLQQADAFAAGLQRRQGTATDRIRYAFVRAYGRPATNAELSATLQFFRRFVPAATKESGNKQQAEQMFLSAFYQGLLTSAEFRFLD